jgi:hypothetical protein
MFFGCFSSTGPRALRWFVIGSLVLIWSAAGCTQSNPGADSADADGSAAADASANAKSPKSAPSTKPEPIPKMERLRSPSPALEVEQLMALGYVDGTYDPNSERHDVLIFNKRKAYRGYNFYSSRRANGARLIDMEGRTVYEWKAKQRGQWQHSELLPNGDVLVIVKDYRLSRYDKDSKLLWSVPGRFHHDLYVYHDEIYVLNRTAKIVDHIHPKWRTLADVVRVYSLDGELQREISLLDVLHRSRYAFLEPSVAHKRFRRGYELDVLHTNHVEVFDGSLSERSPLYAEGNLLVSMRNINSIAIIAGESLEILWLWGPSNLTYQHHPRLLDNGHILLFDNGLERSRVIEVDPLTDQIVWDYAPRKGFFSLTRGSVQRLPNGNTLITESDTGYVLEITPKRQVVWKFANPVVNKKQEREAIWRMTRFDPKSLTFLP